jgi:hypothetical protein
MHATFPWAATVAGREPTPLRVRAAGFTFDHHQPGLQIAWARFTTGIWAAVVTLELSTANRAGCVPVTVWVPRQCVVTVT